MCLNTQVFGTMTAKTGIWLAINFILLFNNTSSLLSHCLNWCQGFIPWNSMSSALEQGFTVKRWVLWGEMSVWRGVYLGVRAEEMLWYRPLSYCKNLFYVKFVFFYRYIYFLRPPLELAQMSTQGNCLLFLNYLSIFSDRQWNNRS